MELQNKRVAILVEENFDDQELIYPRIRLREAGAEVIVVGPQGGHEYKSKHGFPVTSDKASSDVSANDFDAVIIPGGWAPDRMRRDQPLLDFVHNADAQGKVVGAICHAGWVLVSAHVLRGRTVTGFFCIKDDLVNAGAEYVDREVVRDRNLITSRTPADLPAFCQTIIAAIGEAPEAPAGASNGRQHANG